jgi:hypothetical protein
LKNLNEKVRSDGDGDVEAVDGARHVGVDLGSRGRVRGLSWVERALCAEVGDELAGVALGLSAGRNFGERLRIVGGWQSRDTRYTGNPLPLAPQLREEADGIVIEITLSG